jgi:hypothetical protein
MEFYHTLIAIEAAFSPLLLQLFSTREGHRRRRAIIRCTLLRGIGRLFLDGGYCCTRGRLSACVK